MTNRKSDIESFVPVWAGLLLVLAIGSVVMIETSQPPKQVVGKLPLTIPQKTISETFKLGDYSGKGRSVTQIITATGTEKSQDTWTLMIDRKTKGVEFTCKISYPSTSPEQYCGFKVEGKRSGNWVVFAFGTVGWSSQKPVDHLLPSRELRLSVSAGAPKGTKAPAGTYLIVMTDIKTY